MWTFTGLKNILFFAYILRNFNYLILLDQYTFLPVMVKKIAYTAKDIQS